MDLFQTIWVTFVAAAGGGAAGTILLAGIQTRRAEYEQLLKLREGQFQEVRELAVWFQVEASLSHEKIQKSGISGRLSSAEIEAHSLRIVTSAQEQLTRVRFSVVDREVRGHLEIFEKNLQNLTEKLESSSMEHPDYAYGTWDIHRSLASDQLRQATILSRNLALAPTPSWQSQAINWSKSRWFTTQQWFIETRPIHWVRRIIQKRRNPEDEIY